MIAIYPPTGKAKEYGCLACNLYRGCGHSCTYCYAPSVLRMDREEFYNNPQPRKGIIEALKRDAKRIGDKYKEDVVYYKGVKKTVDVAGSHNWFLPPCPKPKRPEVFLCFTTDPYQPINEKYQLTRQAIEILHANEIAVNILTKGVITDFDLLAKRPDLSKVGVTLTFSSNYEPYSGAGNQYKTLSLAQQHKVKRWVSFEPVILPHCVLDKIKTLAVVDRELEFKLGKWNYSAEANKIDWHRFVNEAIGLLERLGCKYYIKEDLREYIA